MLKFNKVPDLHKAKRLYVTSNGKKMVMVLNNSSNILTTKDNKLVIENNIDYFGTFAMGIDNFKASATDAVILANGEIITAPKGCKIVQTVNGVYVYKIK